MASEATKLGRLLNDQGRRGHWLAMQLGTSDVNVSRWCSGKQPIPFAAVPLIAELLGVHEEEIVEAGRVRVA